MNNLNLDLINDDRLRAFAARLINYFQTNLISAVPEVTADTGTGIENHQRNLVYRDGERAMSVDLDPLLYPAGPYGAAIFFACAELREFYGLSRTPTIRWEDFTGSTVPQDANTVKTPTGHTIRVPPLTAGPSVPLGPQVPNQPGRYRNIGGVYEEGAIFAHEGRAFVYVKQNLFGGFWLEIKQQ